MEQTSSSCFLSLSPSPSTTPRSLSILNRKKSPTNATAKETKFKYRSLQYPFSTTSFHPNSLKVEINPQNSPHGITRPFYSPSPKTHHSMVSSNLYHTTSFPGDHLSEPLSDSAVDQLAAAQPRRRSPSSDKPNDDYFVDLSQSFSDCSACSSAISGEFQRLATLPNPDTESDIYPDQQPGSEQEPEPEPEPEPCLGFLRRESFSTEIIESISPEDLYPNVKICIDGLRSNSIAVKRSAAAKLRLLAKNRSDNRVLIADLVAVPALIPLLRCADPWAQEHAVTALLNVSVHESNRSLITNAGAIKSLIYVLKNGTKTSKQNAGFALLSLSLVEENKVTIGACGAIPPLVGLLIHGSPKGKEFAELTLLVLCGDSLRDGFAC